MEGPARISRRHLIRAATGAAAAAALAACGSSSGTTTSLGPTATTATGGQTTAAATAAPAATTASGAASAAAPTATTAQAAATSGTAAPAANGSFTYFNYEWTIGGGLQQRWQMPGDAFEKDTGIKINRKAIPSTEYWDKMITELATGSTTELYYARFNAIDQYVAMDAITPLDDYVNVKQLQDTFFPVQKTDLTRNGKTMAYLCGLSANVMFYNKTILDQAGLKPPTTYDELMAVAKQTTKAPNQYGMGIVTADQPQIMEKHNDFVIGYGSLWGNGKDVMANSPKTVEAITALKSLADAGVAPANQNNPVLRPLFWDGKMAIWFDGPWLPGLANKDIPGLGAAKIPLASGKIQGGPQILIMTKKGSNNKAAGKYLDYISQPEWQKTMTVTSGINSGRAGVDYGDFIAKNPWYQVELDSLSAIVPDPAPGWGTFNAQWTKVTQNKLAEMYAKNRPVKETLDDIQGQLQQLVKDNLK